MENFYVDHLFQDENWYTYTTNRRLIRKYRLTAPSFHAVLDSLQPGFKELLHSITKDIYDTWEDLEPEVERYFNIHYNPFSAMQIYQYIFWKMDLNFKGLPPVFIDFLTNHL